MDPTQQSPITAPVSQNPELNQDQMKTNLQDMMSKIDGKYQDFNSSKFSADNKTVSNKSATMRQLFEVFQSMGVDPSDPEALKLFLDQLKNSNPEMYDQVVTALESILGDGQQDTQSVLGSTPQAVASDIPINNMNIDTNEASSQTI